MKKMYFFAAACLFSLGIMTSCSSKQEVKCECPEDCACVENCHEGGCTCPEGCTDCAGCACTETASEAVGEALQDGQPVQVDVENSEVVTEPNGTQEVENEVTMTPEAQPEAQK